MRDASPYQARKFFWHSDSAFLPRRQCAVVAASLDKSSTITLSPHLLITSSLRVVPSCKNDFREATSLWRLGRSGSLARAASSTQATAKSRVWSSLSCPVPDGEIDRGFAAPQKSAKLRSIWGIRVNSVYPDSGRNFLTKMSRARVKSVRSKSRPPLPQKAASSRHVAAGVARTSENMAPISFP